MNPLVNHLQIQSTFRFDPRGNPYPVFVASYFIDKHGPFSDEYRKENYTPVAVQAGIDANIAMLRQLNALPLGS